MASPDRAKAPAAPAPNRRPGAPPFPSGESATVRLCCFSTEVPAPGSAPRAGDSALRRLCCFAPPPPPPPRRAPSKALSGRMLSGRLHFLDADAEDGLELLTSAPSMLAIPFVRLESAEQRAKPEYWEPIVSAVSAKVSGKASGAGSLADSDATGTTAGLAPSTAAETEAEADDGGAEGAGGVKYVDYAKVRGRFPEGSLGEFAARALGSRAG